ncbi:MAG: stage V sporulation T C-terminal domain-containing protein, partial [Bacillota bacterium]|nr:stage V sporulation T C-terminal domain-containing protein [Bacillota bacterium]
HHTRVDVLDNLIKSYVRKVKDNSQEMIGRLELSIKNESAEVKNNEETVAILEKQLEDAREELKATKRQKIREVMKRPEQEDLIEETYAELEADAENRITGLQSQIELTANRRNTIIRVNRVARTAIDIFGDILQKEKLDKRDLELIVEKILVYEDHLEIELKRDIDMLLKMGEIPEAAEPPDEEKPVNFKPGSMDSSITAETVVQTSKNRQDKVYAVSVISSGDPLEIYTDRDGEVIFKKYSPMGELASFSAQLCDTLNKTTGQACAICDRDTVISAAGVTRRDIIDKRISEELEKLMEGRQLYRFKQGDHKVPVVEGNDRQNCMIAAPIITEGDVSGCVIFMESEGAPAPGETEFKLAQAIAAFLSKQMES